MFECYSAAVLVVRRRGKTRPKETKKLHNFPFNSTTVVVINKAGLVYKRLMCKCEI